MNCIPIVTNANVVNFIIITEKGLQTSVSDYLYYQPTNAPKTTLYCRDIDRLFSLLFFCLIIILF